MLKMHVYEQDMLHKHHLNAIWGLLLRRESPIMTPDSTSADFTLIFVTITTMALLIRSRYFCST